MRSIYDIKITNDNHVAFDTQDGSYNMMSTSHVMEGTNFFFSQVRVNENIHVPKGLQAFDWNNHATQGYAKISSINNRSYSYIGDVTGSGSNFINININSNAVTFPKIQNINGNNLLGRVSNLGNIQTIAITSGLSLSGASLGLSNSGVIAGTYNKVICNNKGVITFAASIPYLTSNQKITITGDISCSGTTGMIATLPIINSNIGNFNFVTVNGKGLITSAQNKPYLTGNQTITISGDLSGSGSSGISTTIGANKVLNTMLRQSAGVSIIGRSANSTGNVADITAASDGLVLKRVGGVVGFNAIGISDLPLSGVSANSYNFVTVNNKGMVTSATNRDYITNQTVTLSGDISGSGSSGISTTIGANKVLNTMIRQSVGVSVVGRSVNTTGNIADITASSDGQVLKRIGGVIGFNSIGTVDINNSVVTYPKIQNIGSNKLVGNVGSIGVMEEIALTSGLVFSGLTLGLTNSMTTYKYNAGSAPTQLTGTKVFTGTSTTNASGVATFQLTTDGTSTGAALFVNIFSISVNARNNTTAATSVPNASVKTVTSGKTVDVNVTSGVVLLLLAATQIFVGAGLTVDIIVYGN